MPDRRLIETAFPLEQTSIDSVHEKNVRHGHISTLHIWPARRPLAASRAALIATLLPDPGTPEKRRELVERLGGRVVKVLKRKQGAGGGEERVVKETVGGILHWGRETSNKADLDFFREEIRKAYGGRAPRVLDPFAGGGAIPLEAMRLGCEVTAIDINPVAWFILKCTLEYPQKLAGQKRPLPDFVRGDRAFMESFFKAQGMKGAMLRTQLKKLGLDEAEPTAGRPTQTSLDLAIEEHTLDADLAWHVRAWGWWVLREARKELAPYYPIYADWEPLKDVGDWREKHPDEAKPMRLVPLRDDGTADTDSLNADVPDAQLANDRQPRWVAKPTVAYLWARTVTCKHCRATIPLLKTRWLAKKGLRRVLLTMEPRADRTGVVFGIENDVPLAGGNNAQRREHDKRIGQGTMTRSGAWCPCCGRPGTPAMSLEDIRAEGMAGRLGSVMTAVVVDGPSGKSLRPATQAEVAAGSCSEDLVSEAFKEVPFGLPSEPTPAGGGTGAGRAFSVNGYGVRSWADLFTKRQLLAHAAFMKASRRMLSAAHQSGLSGDLAAAIRLYLALAQGRMLDYGSSLTHYQPGGGFIVNSFQRFALPFNWDFSEVNPLSGLTGSADSAFEWVSLAVRHLTGATERSLQPLVLRRSAIQLEEGGCDLIITDPPYYDSIPYSDLMDFFYVWLRRSIGDLPGFEAAFEEALSPKWDETTNDGELIDDSTRHGGDAAASKAAYEDGIARAFARAGTLLNDDGRFVIVFANKQPDAWETLVNGTIRAGFCINGSWPIQTERTARSRSLSSAALASSVWLICKKRPASARPGWDNVVLREMRANIVQKLRDFWDAGIHGPDFVWAATGPALEAYSKHPFVKKANAPDEVMSVSEFLKAVRRITVEFVVGRVLGEAAHIAPTAASEAAAGLDDVTTYYLLHRHDFGMNDAPAGACILYALSCNLSEGELADRHDLLLRTGGVDVDDDGEPDEGDADADGEVEEGSGSTFKLKPWKQRRRPTLGVDPIAEQARQRRQQFQALSEPLFDDIGPAAPSGPPRVIPLIDSIHRLMHLWVDGDVVRVNEYLDDRGLRRSETFRQVLQALIELADEASEERSVLESLSNHVRGLGERPETLFDSNRG